MSYIKKWSALEAYIVASQISGVSPTAKGMCVHAIKVLKEWNMTEEEIEIEILNRMDFLNRENEAN